MVSFLLGSSCFIHPSGRFKQMNACYCNLAVTQAYDNYCLFLCLVAVMAGYAVSRTIDEGRASILAQVILREYIEELIEKAKFMELHYGSDYPREISKAFQDLVTKGSEK